MSENLPIVQYNCAVVSVWQGCINFSIMAQAPNVAKRLECVELAPAFVRGG
jgi:hypothetical protein